MFDIVFCTSFNWKIMQLLLHAIYVLHLMKMLLLIAHVEIGLKNFGKVTYHWKIIQDLDALWNLILND